jgi:predicted transposase
METIHTVACKLDLSEEQRQHVADTMQAFAQACQHIEDTLPQPLRNKDRLQTMVYRDVRDRFGLSANLAIRAIARVSTTRKAAAKHGETVKAFSPTSIDYDARIFSFRERDWTVSLTLLHGRERFSMRWGEYQRRRLTGQTPTSAQLCRHRDGVYFLHIQVKSSAPTPQETTDVLGVDLGRIDIAHTSDDQDWNGQDLRDVRDRASRLRAALQKKASKGTRSTRRRCRKLLARLSGNEHRFQRHINHHISKTLVANALASGRALALEDLTGDQRAREPGAAAADGTPQKQ